MRTCPPAPELAQVPWWGQEQGRHAVEPELVAEPGLTELTPEQVELVAEPIELVAEPVGGVVVELELVAKVG